jgi:lipopolysaccharide cholinephosphotransferase
MDAMPPPGPAWITELLYRTHAILDRLLVSAEVPYTANGGTLLGALRHGGVIPWDVDGDIAVRRTDYPGIFERVPELLHPAGFDVFQKSNEMLKVFSLEGRRTGAGWLYPAVDVWPMVMVGDRWAPSDLASRQYWRAEWFEPESFEAMIRRPFGAGEVSSVNDEIAERYLTRNYGPRWRTTYVDYEAGLAEPFHPRPRPARPGSPRPLRHAEGLELHELDDAVIVYQQDPPRVHHLNHTATLVFALCGGELTIDEIVGHLQRDYELDEPPVAEVNSCIERLCEEGVLVVG